MDPFGTLEERVARVVQELEGKRNESRTERPAYPRAPMLHPESARFLHVLVLVGKYRRLLEIGSGYGYSTLWLAEAAHRNGGTLVTCEIEPRVAEANRTHITRAGLQGVVSYLVGDARQNVADLPGPFDFVFIDTVKADYLTYFELLIPKMLPNGLIVADNVISHASELADYLERVKSHPLYESITVPLGAGLEISRRVR